MVSSRTIGKLAKAAGVNIQTVRYYERRRLLSATARKPSGYRLYGEEALQRLRFIKNAQSLGFTLQEIAELLNLRVNTAARCADVKRKAQAKLAGIEEKVRALKALTHALRHLIEACQAGLPTDRCPVLIALQDERRATTQPRQRR